MYCLYQNYYYLCIDKLINTKFNVMKTEQMTIEETTVKVENTMFDRLENKGTCLGSMCDIPKEELVKRTSINGFVSLTCPKCGTIHTENWYKVRVPDPDMTKKLTEWIVN